MEDYLGDDKLVKIIYNQFAMRYLSHESKKQSQELQQLNQKQLANKITKKISFNMTSEIKEVMFLNTFSYRTNQGNTYTYMIAAQLYNHTILFYDLQGQQIVDPYTPGHKIQLMALAPKVDEVIIATLGTDNIVKMVRLENKKIRLNATETTNGTAIEEDEFVFKKYFGQSDIPFEDQKREIKPQNNNGSATYQARRRYKNGTLVSNNNTLAYGNHSNITGLSPQEIEMHNNTKIRIYPASNQTQVTPSNSYKSKTMKSKKPEKFKYQIKREGKFKLIDYQLNSESQVL